MATPSPSPAPGFTPWADADFKVGIQTFDAEHRALGRLIEQLHTAALVHRDRVLAEQIFTHIIQNARIHFVHEEELLERHGYAELPQHIEQHSQLIREALDVQRNYTAGNLSALILTRFLQSWLIDHIKREDRKYSAELKRKGMI